MTRSPDSVLCIFILSLHSDISDTTLNRYCGCTTALTSWYKKSHELYSSSNLYASSTYMWKSFASIGRLPAATRQSCFHAAAVAVVACVIDLNWVGYLRCTDAQPPVLLDTHSAFLFFYTVSQSGRVCEKSWVNHTKIRFKTWCVM